MCITNLVNNTPVNNIPVYIISIYMLSDAYYLTPLAGTNVVWCACYLAAYVHKKQSKSKEKQDRHWYAETPSATLDL